MKGDILRTIVAFKRVLYDALGHFNYDDGWAMASHLAISALMAIFPFLIFATTLVSYVFTASHFTVVDAQEFAQTALHLVFDTWPEQIARPLEREVVNVLTIQRGDLLTYGALLALYFASNGIEALRTSLNRAYRVVETRSFWWRRLQSLLFVVIITVGFAAISLLLVLAPVTVRFLLVSFPGLEAYLGTIALWRYVIASTVIVAGLVAVHIWLPDGRRKLSEVTPGLIFTLAGWLVGSTMFAKYIEDFANYASTYAGLASIMIAVVFLYIVSAVFILGGELNAAISRYLGARARVPSS